MSVTAAYPLGADKKEHRYMGPAKCAVKLQE